MRKVFVLIFALLALAALAQSQSTSTTPATFVTGSGTKRFVPVWTSAHTQGNSTIFQGAGGVGLGTTSPQATLDVESTGLFSIWGATSSTKPFATGVYEQTASTTGAGVVGVATANTGNANGVYGQSDSTNGGLGVGGVATAATGNAYGVSGTTYTTGFGAGVIGEANATTGTAFGGFFGTNSPDGNALFGVANATSGYPTALVGQVQSSDGGDAGSFRAQNASAMLLEGIFVPTWSRVFTIDASGNGFFAGNLTVTGTVSKGGGSFKIDHPLDPANKTLSHSFVESPDMMNVYNGNITTDQHGLATVTLPDYFEALNQDFRYQLTVMGQFAQAIVAKKIAANRFVIRTSKPGVEVSWQVTGIRHDAYANAFRIPVEEEKPLQQQGHYLHPELFGASPEQAIRYQAPTVPAYAQNTHVSSLTALAPPQ